MWGSTRPNSGGRRSMRPPTPADGDESSLGSPAVGGPATSASARSMRARRVTGADSSMPAVSPSAFLGAPVAEALAFAPDAAESLTDAGISNGGCFARPLPIDTSCASVARRFFREAVSSLGIPAGLVHDGVTMASELAANTLHAQRNVAPTGARQRSAAGIPEMWLYLRGTGRTRELVCKVFDTERGWAPGDRPGMS